ncbi:hypothetical protein [Tenacibaculum finnmarkense]|uniref:plasmid mobilization protein n=1 Tax=Tenacibaculum finnmarkense TaxID=2781243 RepID=UPI001EFC001A|nr:hypothetical protein [Tenacibaculum finnmarkense]MCG8226368.1 hypothetical protein [Tenacibaculum finnmarkense genomovar finnmarkense]
MEKTENETRNKRIYARLTEVEFSEFLVKCKELGYEKNRSDLIRKIIIEGKLVTVNPILLIDELYELRNKISKLGNNVNQIANYTNILMNKNQINTSQYDRYNEIQIKFEMLVKEVKNKIDSTLDKI